MSNDGKRGGKSRTPPPTLNNASMVQANRKAIAQHHASMAPIVEPHRPGTTESTTSKPLTGSQRRQQKREEIARIKSRAPSESDLQAEIARRSARRAAHLDTSMNATTTTTSTTKSGVVKTKTTKDFETRPSKPSSLSGNDEHGDSLTAHHMVPHSKIKDEFGVAVRKQDLRAVQNISTFGDEPIDEAEAFRKLAYYKTQKNDTMNRTEQNLRSMYEKASWDSNNVFMGPSPENRTDDPGDSGVDVRYNKGAKSKASTIAEDVFTGGFSSQNPQEFMSRRAASKMEASTLRPYNASDWQSDGSRTTKKGATIQLVKQKTT